MSYNNVGQSNIIFFFLRIRLVGAELFHADGQRDAHDELIVACRNFANSPNKCSVLTLRLLEPELNSVTSVTSNFIQVKPSAKEI